MSVPVDPDSVSEDDLPDNWIETQADAVQEVLEEMTTVYNLEGDAIEVQFDQHSYCDSEGNFIAINPLFWDEVAPPVEGPNILRVLDDILAHEVSHYNWSDLKSKSDFGDMYPECQRGLRGRRRGQRISRWTPPDRAVRHRTWTH